MADVNDKKIERMMDQLSIEFDHQALKQLNEICKCPIVEGLDFKAMEDIGELFD